MSNIELEKAKRIVVLFEFLVKLGENAGTLWQPVPIVEQVEASFIFSRVRSEDQRHTSPHINRHSSADPARREVNGLSVFLKRQNVGVVHIDGAVAALMNSLSTVRPFANSPLHTDDVSHQQPDYQDSDKDSVDAPSQITLTRLN